MDATGFLSAHRHGPARRPRALQREIAEEPHTSEATIKGHLDNVYVALTARSLGADLRIVARAEQQSTVAKLLRAGANSVICPQEIGATRITNVLTRPHVVDFVEVAARGVELEMDEYVVAEGSALCEKTLQESGMRQKTGATTTDYACPGGSALWEVAGGAATSYGTDWSGSGMVQYAPRPRAGMAHSASQALALYP